MKFIYSEQILWTNSEQISNDMQIKMVCQISQCKKKLSLSISNLESLDSISIVFKSNQSNWKKENF